MVLPEVELATVSQNENTKVVQVRGRQGHGMDTKVIARSEDGKVTVWILRSPSFDSRY